MQRPEHRRWTAGKPGSVRPWIVQLEIVPHYQLHAPGLPGYVDSAEEGTEIGIVQGDSPVRMVERVEALGADLDAVAFVHREAAVDGQIEDVVAGADDGVTPGVAECVRRRRAESRGAEEMLDGALAARQGHALAG